MKKIIVILIVSFFVSGCNILHVEEILRLQGAGSNMKEQQAYVVKKNKEFKKLLKVIHENKMSEYKTEQDFLKHFGSPIFSKDISGVKQYSHLWLYRYCEKMFGSEKVYLYFNDAGNLVKWEHRLPKSQ